MNLNLVNDTPSHYDLSFCEVSSNLLQQEQHNFRHNLTSDIIVTLNLILVHDTPSHHVLSFCEVSLNLLQ